VQVRPRIAATKVGLRIGGIVLEDRGHLRHDVLLLVRIAVHATVEVAQVHKWVPRAAVGYGAVPISAHIIA
jgi:hypothetical protein